MLFTISLLPGTLFCGLLFISSPQLSAVILCAAVDADWSGGKETRGVTTASIIVVNSAIVMLRSNRQSLITLSSGEYEYVALCTGARDLACIRKLFWEKIHVRKWDENVHFSATAVEKDCTAAISMTQCEDITIRRKHVSLKFHHCFRRA